MNAPAESPERIRELVALYCRTHYDVTLPDGGTATLRIGEPLPRAITGWIDRDAFALYLSACNPHSQPLPEARNIERMAQLRLRLRHADARWLEGCGRLPGEAWCEPSLLVAGLPLDRLDRLADEFEQNASVRAAPTGIARLRIHRHGWREHLPPTDAIEAGDAQTGAAQT